MRETFCVEKMTNMEIIIPFPFPFGTLLVHLRGDEGPPPPSCPEIPQFARVPRGLPVLELEAHPQQKASPRVFQLL